MASSAAYHVALLIGPAGLEPMNPTACGHGNDSAGPEQRERRQGGGGGAFLGFEHQNSACERVEASLCFGKAFTPTRCRASYDARTFVGAGKSRREYHLSRWHVGLIGLSLRAGLGKGSISRERHAGPPT